MGIVVADAQRACEILHIEDPNLSVKIENINFVNGEGEHGGAIDSIAKSLTLVNCTFANNIAYNGSSIYIQSDTHNPVTRNAGIVIQDTKLVVEDCLFQDNAALDDGGCIASLGGQVCIENSTFNHNYAASDESRGGAIYDNATGTRAMAYRDGNEDTSPLIVKNCSFYDNKAGKIGAAIYSEGRGLCLESSAFSRNNGTSAVYCLGWAGDREEL